MTSIITPDNEIAVTAGLFGIVYVGLLAERTELGRKISAPLIALAGGMLLSNTKILPFQSSAYEFVIGYMVPIAIPLLLLNADVKRIFRETGPTLIAFLAGVVGTMLGTIAGFALIDIGPETHKVFSVLAATYVGGSFNFVAVSQALAIEDATLIASAATAQGIGALLYLSLLIMAPSFGFMCKLYPSKQDKSSDKICTTDSNGAVQAETYGAASTVNVPACITFSLIICAVSFGAADQFGIPKFKILIITTITVILASSAPGFMRKFSGGENIGLFFVYVFIAAVGAQSNVWQLAGTTSVLVGFLAILLTVHASCVLVVGRLFKLTLPEIITGSNACALGATTAAAIAAGKRWHGLVTPGILSGILGYVIANFIGIGLAAFLGSW